MAYWHCRSTIFNTSFYIFICLYLYLYRHHFFLQSLSQLFLGTIVIIQMSLVGMCGARIIYSFWLSVKSAYDLYLYKLAGEQGNVEKNETITRLLGHWSRSIFAFDYNYHWSKHNVFLRLCLQERTQTFSISQKLCM